MLRGRPRIIMSTSRKRKAGSEEPVSAAATLTLPGDLKVTEHILSVPLDHAQPDGPQLSLFVFCFFHEKTRCKLSSFSGG